MNIKDICLLCTQKFLNYTNDSCSAFILAPNNLFKHFPANKMPQKMYEFIIQWYNEVTKLDTVAAKKIIKQLGLGT